MKVLQINAVYGVGSTGVIVRDIHELCLENGIESYVAYSTSNTSPESIINGYQIGNTLDKKLHALLCRINGKQAYFSRGATKKFINHIKEIKPDVVHLHNLHSNYVHLNMLLDFLAKEDIATVITLHDCWFYTGGCFYYTAVNCDKWMQSCGDCPKRFADTPAYIVDRSSMVLEDKRKRFSKIKRLTVVGVSQWISEEANKSFLKQHEICTIYNGIDTDFFVNTPSDFREKYGLQDKFLILGAANKWLKDINKDTLNYFVSNLPDDCKLIIMGCQSNDIEKLPSNVLAIPFTTDRVELKKIYSACDVFANCTREDTFSLINIEPQACGTPSVVYENSGVKETVDNKSSFLIPNGDYQAFFEKVLSIKKIGKSQFSEMCRCHVVSKFDKRLNYLKYIDLYKSLG